MQKIKDPILLGIVAGLTGVLCKTIGNRILRSQGKSKTSYSDLASWLFLNKKDSNKPSGRLVGVLADAALGAGMGVGYVYVLKFTGKDQAIMKGVGYGQGILMLLLGGANKIGMSQTYPLDASSILSAYLEHSFYGLGAALAATKFGDEDLFRKEDIELPQEVTQEVPQGRGRSLNQIGQPGAG